MAAANQRIGEYVLDRQIGRGAFGEVWLARHHVWPERLAAVKIPTDPAYVRDLQREGATVQALEHPNIVRALGADPFADPPYLMTEYVPGTSLRPLINQSVEGRRVLRPAEAVAIMTQVLRGLAYSHAKGVVHRDVKPENILIHERAAEAGYSGEGLVKLTDFGFGHPSNPNERDGGGSIAYSGSMTAGRMAGSQPYMAPEQRDGGPVDGRADLFSCGIVFFEMLTGHRPVGTEVPSDVDPALPKSCDEIFRKSYARLERRFASADEFLQALAKTESDARSYAPAVVAAPVVPVALIAAPLQPPRWTARIVSSAMRGMFSGMLTLAGFALLVAALGIAGADGLKHMEGTPPIEARWIVKVLLYSLGAGAAWGALAGTVTGVMVRPVSLFSGGIVPRTARAAVGLLFGGTLGFGATWLAMEKLPHQIIAAAATATAGALAGAVLGARPEKAALYPRGTLAKPVRMPTAYYPPPRRASQTRASTIVTTAKAVLITFALIIVGQYVLSWGTSFIGCGVVLLILLAGAFGVHHFVRHRHH